MKKKQIGELRHKTGAELKIFITKAEEELVESRVNFAAGRLKDSQAVNKKRHDIARAKTILKEKELLEATQKKGE